MYSTDLEEFDWQGRDDRPSAAIAKNVERRASGYDLFLNAGSEGGSEQCWEADGYLKEPDSPGTYSDSPLDI